MLSISNCGILWWIIAFQWTRGSASRLHKQCGQSVAFASGSKCIRNGPSFVSSAVNWPVNFELPLSDLEAANNSHVGPWAYEPICSEVLERLGSKLCVYTSTKFGGGRGLSILTTPQLAETFAKLHPIRDPSAFNETINSGKLDYDIELPPLGKRAVAKKEIKCGHQVVSNMPPLLIGLIETDLSWREREELLRVAISRLPIAGQQLISNLGSSFRDPDMFLAGVVLTNAGFLIEFEGHEHYALFPEMSLINHHCAPNLQFRINPSTLTIVMQAARDISQGEEVTNSYFNRMRHPHFETLAKRQQIIEQLFEFRCICSRCLEGEKGDEAVNEIDRIETILRDWSDETIATVSDAQRLIDLYKHEGLDAFIDTAYGYAAFRYNAIGDAEMAEHYAKKAIDVHNANDYIDEAALGSWMELLDDPHQHWSWGRQTSTVA